MRRGLRKVDIIQFRYPISFPDMTKSLVIAVLTFAALGAYYNRAGTELAVVEKAASSVEDPREAARSAALAGINVAKEGLVQSWRSRLFAGRHRGAKYNSAATVRDERARIESIGRAIGAGGISESYRLRVEVYRSRRHDANTDGEHRAYSYRIRPLGT